MIIKLNVSDLSKLNIYEISDHRQFLLKASLSERQTNAWRVKWIKLQELEQELDQFNFKEIYNDSQTIYPWTNSCSNSLILTWRDHLYKDIGIDSRDLELATEFSLSQDLFKRKMVKRPGLLAKLQAWVAKKVKERTR